MERMTRTLILGLVYAAVVGASSASAQRKAEEVYKEIKVLNGMPADQLNATMQFFEASLGVGCNFCHLEDRAQNTERKDVARKMVQMVRDVNKNTFEGDTEVTCYTCHRGQTGPPENPALANAEFRPWEPDSPNGLPNAPPVAGPAPAQIIDKWITAIGGMDKISKITSAVSKSTATNSVGATQQRERITKGDNSLLILGNATIARSGNTGWFRAGNGNPRDIRNYEMNDNRFGSTLWLARNAKSFSMLTSRQDEIGNRPVYQVRGVTSDGVPVRMFFGRETGHLLRLLWFTPNAVGQNMSRIDYSNFGDVDGILIARRQVVRTPLSYQIVRVDSIQWNVPVEDSRFTRPAGR